MDVSVHNSLEKAQKCNDGKTKKRYENVTKSWHRGGTDDKTKQRHKSWLHLCAYYQTEVWRKTREEANDNITIYVYTNSCEFYMNN